MSLADRVHAGEVILSAWKQGATLIVAISERGERDRRFYGAAAEAICRAVRRRVNR